MKNRTIKSALILSTLLVSGVLQASYNPDKGYGTPEHRPGMDFSACWLVNIGYARYIGDENSGKLFITNPYFKGRNLDVSVWDKGNPNNPNSTGINPSHFYVDMLKIDGRLREIAKTLMPVYTYLDADPEVIYDEVTDTIAEGYVKWGCSDEGMSVNEATRTSPNWSREEYRTGNYVILEGIVKSNSTTNNGSHDDNLTPDNHNHNPDQPDDRIFPPVDNTYTTYYVGNKSNGKFVIPTVKMLDTGLCFSIIMNNVNGKITIDDSATNEINCDNLIGEPTATINKPSTVMTIPSIGWNNKNYRVELSLSLISNVLKWKSITEIHR